MKGVNRDGKAADKLNLYVYDYEEETEEKNRSIRGFEDFLNRELGKQKKEIVADELVYQDSYMQDEDLGWYFETREAVRLLRELEQEFEEY